MTRKVQASPMFWIMALIASPYTRPSERQRSCYHTDQNALTSEAAAARCDAVGHTSTLGEPLGNDAHRTDELKPHSPAKAYALAQEQLPDVAGEARPDQ